MLLPALRILTGPSAIPMQGQSTLSNTVEQPHSNLRLSHSFKKKVLRKVRATILFCCKGQQPRPILITDLENR
uniref:Uncharacterized protein n=1 Tax=Utricularia reniformis TaxID=192314 RepID=A0A1Y0B2S8_9LAMI|nr:hypothetical protein AEK19_MT1559 [Utricularia reniformis]ART31746.1 hypothetical protein AEK19_MT1559 [Utricularia reniformis]